MRWGKVIISRKLLAIIAAIVITTSGVGYAVASGAIYLGPKVPGFNITGIGTTDVGVSVHFGVSFSSAPASTPYYLWFANGQSGTGEYFTMSFSSPGIHNISLQVSMSNNHTKRIEYAIETVNPDPTVKISENKNTIDAGQNISFSSSVSGGTGPFTYSWFAPANNPFGNLTQFYDNSDPNVQLYSDIGGINLVVTDAAGFSVSSNVLSPVINTDPFVTASSNTTYTDVGSSVTFSASSYYGTAPYSYSWTWNGNIISTLQDFSYSFDQSGQQCVYVTVTDKVGMTASDNILIEVEKSPTVSITASEQDAPAGTQISFLANVNNGLGPFSYQWYINGSLVTSGDYGSALYYTFNGAANYIISVIVTDQVGETATAQMTETIT
jgi:hypothetical protein